MLEKLAPAMSTFGNIPAPLPARSRGSFTAALNLNIS